MRNVLLIVTGFVLLTGGLSAQNNWPKSIETSEGKVTMYQPQIESFSGDTLEGRAAVSVLSSKPGSTPVYGAVWLTTRVDVDKDTRTVIVRDVKIPHVRFADATEEEEAKLAAFLEKELPTWHTDISLDELVASMEADGAVATPGLRHQPPKIIYSQEPAILVMIDGEPRLEKIEQIKEATVERVVNTPFLIVRNSGSYYLSGGGDLWYQASGVTGPWQVSQTVPAVVSKLVTEDSEEEPGEGPPPKIIVSTEPAELIVSDGEPNWTPVEGMDLLYMANTDADVFLEITTQSYYVLLSGRWYRGTAVQTDWQWTHVPNDELPDGFSDLSEESPNGSVLAHVAGTDQAREAILEQSIPQTAAVRRDDTSLEVEYDGKPEFEKVKGADGNVEAAVNTTKSVFKVKKKYYSCDEGIWYVSNAPTGPWSVAAEIPDVIYSIPASDPNHNVTYVKVYDVTPEVVYVGYTPGYMGSYVYNGCVVYGTGWYYSPWYGPYYHPRPWTWGLHVSYNPWTGWGFGIGFSNGPFRFGFGWGGGYYRPPYYGGWWGPGRYRPYPRPYVRGGYRKTNININTGDINIGNRVNAGTGNRIDRTRPNLYNRSDNQARLAQRPQTRDLRQPSVARDRSNNVLTDRSGNVYRRENNTWQTREGGQWKPAEGLDRSRPSRPSTRPSTPTTRPATPSTRPTTPTTRPAAPSTRPSRPTTRPSTGATRPQLERDWSSRQRGAQRSQSYSRSRASRPSTPNVRRRR